MRIKFYTLLSMVLFICTILFSCQKDDRIGEEPEINKPICGIYYWDTVFTDGRHINLIFTNLTFTTLWVEKNSTGNAIPYVIDSIKNIFYEYWDGKKTQDSAKFLRSANWDTIELGYVYQTYPAHIRMIKQKQ